MVSVKSKFLKQPIGFSSGYWRLEGSKQTHLFTFLSFQFPLVLIKE